MFFFINFNVFFFYLFSSVEKESYILKYEISYDQKLIDKSVYELLIQSKLSGYETDAKQEHNIKCTSFIDCKDREGNLKK